MPVLISLGVAGAITLLCAVGLGCLRSCSLASLTSAPSPRPAQVPIVLRCLKWPLQVLAGVCAPMIPDGCLRVVARDLARAELDTLVEPAQWLALSLMLAAFAASTALPLGLLLPGSALARAGFAALSAGLAPWLWLRDRRKRLKFAVLRDLPGCLDTLTLALEAGCALGSALQLVVERAADSPLRRALARCQQEMRAGRARREALERLAQRLAIPALSATVAAIVQAETTGVSLAPVMRAQAVRGTQERFARAEKLAMEAPIRMLAPLVICIFPCTFIVIGFPIAATLFWGA